MTSNVEAQQTAFADRLFRDLLGAVTVFSVALGEQLGLYAALQDGAVTSSELAKRAGIAERYAREWLEQQAADGIIEVARASADDLARQYALPEAHVAVLADREHLDFATPLAQVITAGIVQLPAIADAFRTGGGVSWEAYGTAMRNGQGDANRTLFLHALPDLLAGAPDVHNRLIAGARVAEVGSGMGWAAIGLARAYPLTTVDGYDLDAPSVEAARRHAEAAGVADRVHFHAGDAAQVAGQYDVVMAFECVHDLAQPVAVLSSMRAMMVDGGVCLVMDERVGESFTAPADEVERLMYGYSLLVCLADGMSHQPSAATGTVMRPPILRRYAADAGFADVEILEALDHPFFCFYRLHATARP